MSKKAVALATVMLLTVGSSAMANLLVYEGFNYYVPGLDDPNGWRPGVSIAGQGNNGTCIGFDTTYETWGYPPGVVYAMGGDDDGSTTYNPVTSGETNVPYPTASNVPASMEPLGNHAYSASGVVGQGRVLSSAGQFGDTNNAGETVFWSYTINKWRTQYYGMVEFTGSTGKVEMGFGNGGQYWYGNATGTGTMVRTYYAGGPGPAGELLAPNQQATWLVMGVTFNGAGVPDSVNMYINPDASQAIALQTPYCTITGLDIGDITNMGGLGWGRDARFDEIRVGEGSSNMETAWANLMSNPTSQGVPGTTVGASNDARTGAGYDLRLDATGDAYHNGNTGGARYYGLMPVISPGEGTTPGMVIRFDVDDSAAAGQTLSEAKIVLTPYHLFYTPNVQISAYLVTSDWDDDDSDPTLDANCTFDLGTKVAEFDNAFGGGLIELDVTAIAQAWADGTTADYGVYLRTEYMGDDPNTTDVVENEGDLWTGRRDLVTREHVPYEYDGSTDGTGRGWFSDYSNVDWQAGIGYADPDVNNDADGYIPDYDTGYWGLEVPALVISYGGAHPGDANEDDIVDLQDFGILKANYGVTVGATWGDADFNGDGAVDLQDFGILKAHYGHTPGDPLQSVPEPATMSLLALGGLALIRRRK